MSLSRSLSAPGDEEAVLAYIEAFRRGVPCDDEANIARGVCGRICQGDVTHPVECFRRLTNNPDKPFSWVVGSDALSKMVGLPPVKLLRMVGFEKDWIQAKLDRGRKFRLAVFPAAEATLASWDGIFELVSKGFPPRVAEGILVHRELLQKTPMPEFEAMLGVKFLEVDLAGKEHPKFLDVARMEALEIITAAHARAFLYHMMGLNEHFDGGGVTKDSAGRKFFSEYLTANVEVESIPGFHWIELDVSHLEDFE